MIDDFIVNNNKPESVTIDSGLLFWKVILLGTLSNFGSVSKYIIAKN